MLSTQLEIISIELETSIKLWKRLQNQLTRASTQTMISQSTQTRFLHKFRNAKELTPPESQHYELKKLTTDSLNYQNEI